MLELLPGVTLAAFAGLMSRESDVKAKATVLAMDRLRWLERIKTTSGFKVVRC